jgi:hypothetical protein
MQSTASLQAAGLAKIQHDPAEVRCRCLVCGAHAFALPGVALSGRCGNCHSFDLEPIEAVQAPRRRITSGDGWALALPAHEAIAA